MPSKNPLPTEVLKARGTYRKDRRPGEPGDEVDAPDCPEFLDGEGRAEWERLVPLLLERRTMSLAAAGTLAGMCQNWSLFVEASKRLNALIVDPKAKAMDLRRWSTLAHETYGHYLRAVQEFGLTPASKAKVQASPAKAKKDDNGKSRYFRAG